LALLLSVNALQGIMYVGGNCIRSRARVVVTATAAATAVVVFFVVAAASLWLALSQHRLQHFNHRCQDWSKLERKFMQKTSQLLHSVS
jgi:hypothetical protein